MFKLKLCKLNSSTDIPTQACFDQNLLKITPVKPTVDANNKSLSLDDYHIAVLLDDIKYNSTFK